MAVKINVLVPFKKIIIHTFYHVTSWVFEQISVNWPIVYSARHCGATYYKY